MKKLLAILITVFAVSAFAESVAEAPTGAPVDDVRIRVWNMGNQVELEAWNTGDRDVMCSGWVTLHSMLGGYRNENYWEVIYRGMFRRTTYRTYNWNDRFTYVYENIRCYER